MIILNVLNDSYPIGPCFVKMAFNKDFIISISEPLIDVSEIRSPYRYFTDALCSVKILVIKNKGISFAKKLDTALFYVKESFDDIVHQLKQGKVGNETFYVKESFDEIVKSLEK